MTTVDPKTPSAASVSPALVRSLNLPLAVLFGLGVTIGAGIYVLVGATAGRAGMHDDEHSSEGAARGLRPAPGSNCWVASGHCYATLSDLRVL